MTAPPWAWFAAGATLIGAFVSIFRPDNGACPINLAPRGRILLTLALATAQGFLQAMVGGDTWQSALLSSIASFVTVLGAHGHTLGDHPLLAQPVAQFRTITMTDRKDN